MVYVFVLTLVTLLLSYQRVGNFGNHPYHFGTMHQTDSMASDIESFLFRYLSVFLISLFLKIHTALISLNHSTGFTNSLSCHLTRRSLSSWKFIRLLSWVFFVHNCNMSYPVSLISLLVFKAHFGCDSFPLATEPLEYNSLSRKLWGKDLLS